nr:ATP-dependent helicase [Actinomycetota bacterium]
MKDLSRKDLSREEDSTPTMGFDPDQQQVVDHRNGRLLALGGPGTGKSTVLEERFVRLALSDGCAPDRVLFLVTNRGQKIVAQDRITRRLLFDEGIEALIEVPVYTWHGLAHHLVSRHYERLEYPEPPVLLTSPEQWGDVRDALASESDVNWPHYKSMLRSESFVDEVVDFCIRAEQRVLQEAELRRLTEARPEYTEIIRFYRRHRNRLRVGARIDYPTLLEDATSLIADHDDVRAGLHGRFTHILVDDAQELARVQQRLLLFLAGADAGASEVDGRSLVVAADPDSSIEAFRGAEPEWLGRFEADFGAHQKVSLGTSYRLGAELGGRANQFIERTGEAGHRPQSFAGAAGVEAWSFAGLAAEADGVARALRLAHLKDGVAYEDMAVLMTSPASMLPPLERALGAVEVPYSISVPD